MVMRRIRYRRAAGPASHLRKLSRGAAFVLALHLVACADLPSGEPAAIEANDPFESANRRSFAAYEAVDNHVIEPAARGYRSLVPAFGRSAISNLLSNLTAPTTFLNDLLQGNPSCAGEALAGLGLNTVLGLGGLIDIGTDAGIPPHRSDFGQTLGVWGVDPGPYFYSGFGPSNPRDILGFAVDLVADPFNVAAVAQLGYGAALDRFGASIIDFREEHLEVIDDLKRNSLDYYAVRRSIIQQLRSNAVARGRRAHKWSDPPGCGAEK
jgi:phospholipid-binding lipoprotein MlaA